MQNKKILITGATGQIATPIALSLAKENEVWCAGRFGAPGTRSRLEKTGARTFQWSFESEDFNGLPADFDHLIHAAWNTYAVGHDYDAALQSNVEGTALLINHCKAVKSLLFVSSLVVYRPSATGQVIHRESGEAYVGDFPFLPTYPLTKVAGEALVRSLARIFSLPTTIARLGMGYGNYGTGGTPVIWFNKILSGEPIYRFATPQFASLIYEEDILANVEPLLQAASVPATTVNWTSDEIVSDHELYEYLGRLAGVEPNIVVDETKAATFFAADSTRRRAITGPSRVSWKMGLLKVLRARFPDHKFPAMP
jgi:nucleoside-diphosphate-sugar epimerase